MQVAGSCFLWYRLGLSRRDVSVSHHLALPLKKQVCIFLELSGTNLLFLVRVKLEWLL